ncbi:twin-arginine translocase subunit TatC [Alicyclobacillaceae bacterium I2511]|nr:twin-arginine translocase subunit TatC [Alicyclobacillaceae bacterium I2511]
MKQIKDKMTAIQHFEDLRKRFIYTSVIFLAFFLTCLAFISHIYSYLVSPLQKYGFRLMVISPGEVISVYFSMAGLVAIGLTLPFALWQAWLFISPGLTETERKHTFHLLPIIIVMFLVGVTFAWLIIFPTILHFLLLISSQHFSVMIRAREYFSFVTGICLPFGFVFELPVVVVFLTRMGLLTPHWLRKKRKLAYLGIVLLGVLISPPELISHLSVVVPMMLLYEISIGLCAMSYRKRQRISAALMKSVSS